MDLNVASIDARMSLTASSPSTRQAVGCGLLGRSQAVRAGWGGVSAFRPDPEFRSVPVGAGVALGLGAAVLVGTVVAVDVAVGTGVAVPTSGVTVVSSA